MHIFHKCELLNSMKWLNSNFFFFLFWHEDTRGKMSLSRNGTLEKTVSDHSERGCPSRAGSGVVVPPPYSPGGSEAADTPLELRGSLDCWACSVLVTAQNMIIALINGLLASIVFGTILTPALTMIIFGFLCHSTVRISRRNLLFRFSVTDRCVTGWKARGQAGTVSHFYTIYS